ncbi:hypothetical protein EVAR_6427_1 [Eumeta japonica]|uniref:Uncharacterized protein n=1 Tax=Eumeta variegata TaxID=151549 RepID=A0A4C1TCN2_EUMVA|nr:hypothetical protein EVAR_6427_1 [Eumeta japonica]
MSFFFSHASTFPSSQPTPQTILLPRINISLFTADATNYPPPTYLHFLLHSRRHKLFSSHVSLFPSSQPTPQTILLTRINISLFTADVTHYPLHISTFPSSQPTLQTTLLLIRICIPLFSADVKNCPTEPPKRGRPVADVIRRGGGGVITAMSGEPTINLAGGRHRPRRQNCTATVTQYTFALRPFASSFIRNKILRALNEQYWLWPR